MAKTTKIQIYNKSGKIIYLKSGLALRPSRALELDKEEADALKQKYRGIVVDAEDIVPSSESAKNLKKENDTLKVENEKLLAELKAQKLKDV